MVIKLFRMKSYRLFCLKGSKNNKNKLKDSSNRLNPQNRKINSSEQSLTSLKTLVNTLVSNQTGQGISNQFIDVRIALWSKEQMFCPKRAELN